MIKLKNVSSGYKDNIIIKDINLEFKSENFYSIIGLNGSGKSTLLNTIMGLINYEGLIEIDGVNIKKMNIKDRSKKISYLTQSNSIEFSYNVIDTILMARYPFTKGIFKQYTNEDYNKVEKIIKELNIESIKYKLYNDLSGGQQQKVHLAKALINNPDILLLDEPTNHLDLSYKVEILDYIKEWSSKKNKLVIAILHDLNFVMEFSEKVVLIDKGKVLVHGNKKDVLTCKSIDEVYKLDIQNYMKKNFNMWL